MQPAHGMSHHTIMILYAQNNPLIFFVVNVEVGNVPVSRRCTEDEKLIQSLRMLNATGQLTLIDARHAFLFFFQHHTTGIDLLCNYFAGPLSTLWLTGSKWEELRILLMCIKAAARSSWA